MVSPHTPILYVFNGNGPQYELTTRYVVALQAWERPGVAEAAALIGMGQREYCDRFVQQYPPLMWTATTSDTVRLIPDEIYADAVKIMQERRQATEQGNG